MNRILIALLLITSQVIYAQDIFWADKEVISGDLSFFSQLEAGDGIIYSTWQSVNYFPDIPGGVSTLEIRVSRDGYTWERVSHNIPGVEFYGVTPIKNYDSNLTENGDLLISYLTGDEGVFNIVDNYIVNEGDFSVERLSRINSQKSVVSPSLYLRGDGGYILFVSSLKDRELDNELNTLFIESGALTIYAYESDDGVNWNEPYEFTDIESDQSYLPTYRDFNGREYVIYQSVVTASTGNTFQLYIRYREDGGDWTPSKLITDYQEYVTGAGNIENTEFDNQRPSYTLKNGLLGITWERKYGFETSQIYYSDIDTEDEIGRLLNPERITTGSRSCSRPKGFEFGGKFYLIWFDNQLGSNDIVMAEPDPQTGLWLEKVVSEDRNYTSVFGDFILYDNSIRIYWEDQNINRSSYNLTRSRILLLNPDRSVNSPVIISNYKKRDNVSVVKLSWTKPEDSSGIKSFYYSWGKVGEEPTYSERVLSTVTTSDNLFPTDDGEYEFLVYAEDNAGNISETSSYIYNYDRTPPDQVDFPEPRLDEKGYLLSNTGDLFWDTWDDDVAGFSYRLTYLGNSFDIEDFRIDSIEIPNNFTTRRSISFNNIDDGYYALTVKARDIAGNVGKPEALIFKADKYIPVTYISYINYNQNENGELVTTIYGRGFRVDGDITTVILDRDGVAPWDYEFQGGEGFFTVPTDRRIEGPNLDEIEGGTYRVGIIHPVRGLVLSNPIIRVESTGTIKFGDFTKGYEEVWQEVDLRPTGISYESIIFWIIITIAIVLTIFTIFKLINTGRDTRKMFHDAKALIKSTPFLSEKDILRIRDMKRQGIGLRLKFTALIIGLIVGVILLISLPLANFMIDTQKKNLTDSLVNRTEILLNSISTSAYEYIAFDQVFNLDTLIKTSEAMDEVIWGTITGVSDNDNNILDAIWATTDDSIGYYTPLPETISTAQVDEFLGDIDRELFQRVYTLGSGIYRLNSNSSLEDRSRVKIELTDSGYPRELSFGITRYSDVLESSITELIKNIEAKGTEELLEKEEELLRLGVDIRNATDSRVQEELQDIISELERQIGDALKSMASNTGIVPDLDYKIVENEDSYLFYKPILYNESGIEPYYKGMVRLRVSTDTIREEIALSRRALTYRVIFTAIVAILIGLLGAVVLATVMINPIKTLVAGIQVIRDTEDKSQLKSHEISVKSRDELFTLASTVNQMTEGLVKAAATAKDVTMGKEIQKMFIPLEADPSGEGKLTTGEFENDDVSIFGYYEGAKGVSGDYFDYKQLDDEHFAMIKCDIAGKGIPASLIMVEVATIFLSYFRTWDKRKNEYRIDELVYSMNDLLEERGFKGRFAALIVVILNSKTGKCYMCNAGDNLVNIYRHRLNKMETMVLHEVPAAGIFSSDLLEMQGGYKVETTTLNRGDILFLFTDGVEEAKHLFRDENYNLIKCEHPGLKEGELHDTHAVNEEFEELGVERIDNIINSVIHKTKYDLKKYHYPQPEAKFTFNFSQLTGNVKDAVLGLISVEKIFRLNPDPSSSVDDVIKVDRVVNNFLMKHFEQFSDYFKFKVQKEEGLPHEYYSHLKEDDQYDDLTILALKKK